MMANKIEFHEINVKSKLLHRRRLKSFLSNLFVSEGQIINNVNIIFCSDKYLLKLNRTHLHHNYYTDTITFPLSNPDEPLIGEIYISTDRVKENAHALKIPYGQELLRVIFHSSLHLCGYSDTSPRQKRRMEAIQERYLQEWNVSRETPK